MPSRKPKIYIASPLGFSELGRLGYERVKVLVAAAGFEILDPWTLTDESIIATAASLPYGADRKKAWGEVNLIIAKNNVDAIKSCDVLLAILDGTDVDSGTASEIGYASALAKIVIGYRGDFRLSSDNDGSTVNLQVQYFLTPTYPIASDLENLGWILEGVSKKFR